MDRNYSFKIGAFSFNSPLYPYFQDINKKNTFRLQNFIYNLIVVMIRKNRRHNFVAECPDDDIIMTLLFHGSYWIFQIISHLYVLGICDLFLIKAVILVVLTFLIFWRPNKMRVKFCFVILHCFLNQYDVTCLFFNRKPNFWSVL